MNFGTIDMLTRIALAQAEGPAPGEGAAPPGLLGSPLMFIMILVLFMYLFVMRPQQKREKARRLMLASLSKGASVITTGGIKGTVVGLTDANVVIRVDDNTKIEFVRQAVAHVVPKDGDDDEAE